MNKGSHLEIKTMAFQGQTHDVQIIIRGYLYPTFHEGIGTEQEYFVLQWECRLVISADLNLEYAL